MNAPDFEIYTTGYCGYCRRAKDLLAQKQASYEDIRVDAEPERRAEMVQRSGGRRTVPQIFIERRPIGGCDELYRFERERRLDDLLSNPREY